MSLGYAKSYIPSMHKNDFEKDLDADLKKGALSDEDMNNYLQAAKELMRPDLIKIIESRMNRFNRQSTVRERIPSPVRSRMPVRSRRRSRSRSRRRRSSRSHSGSPTTARAPRNGGRSIHKRRTAKNKHRHYKI
jgi:hypothetical protein